MGSLLPGRQKFFHQRVRNSPVAHDGEKNSGNPGQQLGFDKRPVASSSRARSAG